MVFTDRLPLSPLCALFNAQQWTTWSKRYVIRIRRESGECQGYLLNIPTIHNLLWFTWRILPGLHPPMLEGRDSVAPLKSIPGTQNTRLSSILSNTVKLCLREVYTKPASWMRCQLVDSSSPIEIYWEQL